MDQGMLLLLVSEVCAPHAWFTDEVMVLPAVLTALYRTQNPRPALLIFCLLTGTALFEFFAGVKLVSPFYMWTAPAWLAWYLFARASNRKEAMRPPAVAA